MTRPGFLAAILLILPAALAAQTPADGAQARLEALVKNHDLPIRDFLADPKVEYGWSAGHLTHAIPHLFETGILRANSVKIKQSNGLLDQVTISGKRRIALRDAAGKIGAAPQTEDMTLQVDLRGQGPATVDELFTSLFFASAEEMAAAVPSQFAGFAPGRPEGVPAPGDPANKNKMWIRQDGLWKQVDRTSEDFRLPKIVVQPAPEFAEEVRRLGKVSGNVLIGIEVDEGGKVAQMWLARPLAPGLDEKALISVSQYRFIPCMWQGHPVGIAMAIEVNMQIR